jgi:hypothetical protein
MLANDPRVAAQKLVETVANNQKDFVEFQMIRPWTVMLSLLRMQWENITKTARTPKYTLHLEDAYKPDIE